MTAPTFAGPVAPGAERLGGVGTAPVSVENASTANDQGRATTLQRHAGRAVARKLLDGIGMKEHRLRSCGYYLGEGRMFRKGGDGRVRSVAVERCANSRACPTCGPQIAAVRAAEIGATVYRWMTGGEERSAIFVSIAASHKATDRLEDLHDQLLTARAEVMRYSDLSWRRFRERFGIADVAWKLEHSCGERGPHPGLHAVFLVDRWWEAEDAQAAEAWLVLRFRAELKAAGFDGKLSAEYGIDVRPVDNPAGAGKYLVKWGVGSELAREDVKLGRNETSIPYNAIPSVLAQDIGRTNPYVKARRDPYVRRLVTGWGEFVKLATSDGRKWFVGFSKKLDLVPELRGLGKPAEIIAAATEVLPAELRPAEHDDGEREDDDEDGIGLRVEGDAWRVALFAWSRPELLPAVWAQRRWRWTAGQPAPTIPLELAIAWLAEDEGIDVAAEALADLADAHLFGHEHGLTVGYPGGHPGRAEHAETV